VTGRIVHANAEGKAIYLTRTAAVTGVTFAVALAQSGGSDGGQSSPATWTYTVTAKNGQSLTASAASPVNGRTNGTTTAATAGIAWYESDGSLSFYAFETPGGTASCPTS
jgi:hypothetical protein